MAPPPPAKPPRMRIQDVRPVVDCGRAAPKRTVGDAVLVSAALVRDGHEALAAVVRHRPPDGAERLVAMTPEPDGDHWSAVVPVDVPGRHEIVIEAWVDPLASWQRELARKVEAGQAQLASELAEGQALVRAAARRLPAAARPGARAAVAALANGDQDEAVRAALDPDLADALASAPPRVDVTRSGPWPIDVDRERARFGAWYELFPRSWGGFAGVERHLGAFADLGFDVLYFPPIHPIGHTHRKGRNNAPVAEPGDPGSPWAIGSEEGGHTAVHPDLGTVRDFERLVARAREHGLEIALDLAIQCSPDHPWIAEHPEWFYRRPDGTLKYAENPPKRYQDIYNLDLACADWRALWSALRDVVATWMERGVRVFRVDNPHTKPVAFWEWLIADIRSAHPDVVFLSEAFTRPAMMYELARVGFSQSYTYFTWKNTRWELETYMSELASDEVAEFLRPNLFANTPDILTAYLQEGGRPAFEARLVLAATLSPSYGIYSGFEHCENVAVAPGSEEYLNSEKYEVRARELDGPLLPLVRRLNEIRRECAALQRLGPLRFLDTHNDALLAYARGTGPEAVIVCVNLDPAAAREGLCEVPGDLGLPEAFTARDLLTGAAYDWRRGSNYLRLDPAALPAHVMAVEA